MKEIKKSRKILIVGDSCRGKSTMAEWLSKKLNLKHLDLDDFFWVHKFTVKRETSEQLELVKTYLRENNTWIIEGTTRKMMSLCLEEADVIIHLRFKSLLSQLICITKRSIEKKENFWGYLDLCFSVILKRYKLGKGNKGKPSVQESIADYSYKVVELNTWEEIEEFKKNMMEE